MSSFQVDPRVYLYKHVWPLTPDDLPDVTPRIPQKQLLIEMAALVKEQVWYNCSYWLNNVLQPLVNWS